MRRLLGVCLLVLALGACANEAKGERTDVLKADYEGNILVPPGSELVRIEHSDPYQWVAELRFTGSSSELLNALARNLSDLDFTIDRRMVEPSVTTCAAGQLTSEGTGDCAFVSEQSAGGGVLNMRIRRAHELEAGTLVLTRDFAHRMPDDEIGPPYPDDE